MTQAPWGTREGTGGRGKLAAQAEGEASVCGRIPGLSRKVSDCPRTRAHGGRRVLPARLRRATPGRTENARTEGEGLEGKETRAKGETNCPCAPRWGLGGLRPRARGGRWGHQVSPALRGDLPGRRGCLSGTGSGLLDLGAGLGALGPPLSPSGPSTGAQTLQAGRRLPAGPGAAGCGASGALAPGTGGPRAPGRRPQGQCPGRGAGKGAEGRGQSRRGAQRLRQPPAAHAGSSGPRAPTSGSRSRPPHILEARTSGAALGSLSRGMSSPAGWCLRQPGGSDLPGRRPHVTLSAQAEPLLLPLQAWQNHSEGLELSSAHTGGSGPARS